MGARLWYLSLRDQMLRHCKDREFHPRFGAFPKVHTEYDMKRVRELGLV